MNDEARSADPADGQVLDALADLWEARDPVPAGLVGRMQRHARAEADLLATDWDHELMQLVERSTELVGTRSTVASYLLRFSHGDLELLVRVAPTPDGTRLDGWAVPPLPATVRVMTADGLEVGQADAGESGRFALTGIPPGLVRLRLAPHDPERTTIVTPTFEI